MRIIFSSFSLLTATVLLVASEEIFRLYEVVANNHEQLEFLKSLERHSSTFGVRKLHCSWFYG